MEVTAEVHFAQLLASNQKQTRDRTLKKLNKWFESKSCSDDAFSEDGMLKLWKGLYYYFWNLDKPLVQESMAAVISEFMMSFRKSKYVFLYVDTCFQTMAREWFGIDRYRLEKFMMFIRKFLNQCFQFLKQQKWDVKCVKQFRKCLAKTVACPENESCPVGLKLHVVDIYMDELAKVGAEELTAKQTRSFLVPYARVLAYCDNEILVSAVQKDIFLYLPNQDVDPDTFAEFPILKFTPSSIILLLQKYVTMDIRKRNLKIIKDTISRFKTLTIPDQNAEELDEPETINPPIRKRAIKKAAENLILEDEQFSSEKLKRKKKQKAALS